MNTTQTRQSGLLSGHAANQLESQSLLDDSLVLDSQPTGAAAAARSPDRSDASFCVDSQTTPLRLAAPTGRQGAPRTAATVVPDTDNSDTDFEDEPPPLRRLKDRLLDESPPPVVDESPDRRPAAAACAALTHGGGAGADRAGNGAECDGPDAETQLFVPGPRTSVLPSGVDLDAETLRYCAGSQSPLSGCGADPGAETQLFDPGARTSVLRSDVELNAETQRFASGGPPKRPLVRASRSASSVDLAVSSDRCSNTDVNLEDETQLFDQSALSCTSVDLHAETQSFNKSALSSSSKSVNLYAETQPYRAAILDSSANGVDLEAETQLHVPTARVSMKAAAGTGQDIAHLSPPDGAADGVDLEAATQVYRPAVKDPVRLSDDDLEAATQVYRPRYRGATSTSRSETHGRACEADSGSSDVDLEAPTQAYCRPTADVGSGFDADVGLTRPLCAATPRVVDGRDTDMDDGVAIQLAPRSTAAVGGSDSETDIEDGVATQLAPRSTAVVGGSDSETDIEDGVATQLAPRSTRLAPRSTAAVDGNDSETDMEDGVATQLAPRSTVKVGGSDSETDMEAGAATQLAPLSTAAVGEKDSETDMGDGVATQLAPRSTRLAPRSTAAVGGSDSETDIEDGVATQLAPRSTRLAPRSTAAVDGNDSETDMEDGVATQLAPRSTAAEDGSDSETDMKGGVATQLPQFPPPAVGRYPSSSDEDTATADVRRRPPIKRRRRAVVGRGGAAVCSGGSRPSAAKRLRADQAETDNGPATLRRAASPVDSEEDRRGTQRRVAAPIDSEQDGQGTQRRVAAPIDSEQDCQETQRRMAAPIDSEQDCQETQRRMAAQVDSEEDCRETQRRVTAPIDSEEDCQETQMRVPAPIDSEDENCRETQKRMAPPVDSDDEDCQETQRRVVAPTDLEEDDLQTEAISLKLPEATRSELGVGDAEDMVATQRLPWRCTPTESTSPGSERSESQDGHASVSQTGWLVLPSTQEVMAELQGNNSSPPPLPPLAETETILEPDERVWLSASDSDAPESGTELGVILPGGEMAAEPLEDRPNAAPPREGSDSEQLGDGDELRPQVDPDPLGNEPQREAVPSAGELDSDLPGDGLSSVTSGGKLRAKDDPARPRDEDPAKDAELSGLGCASGSDSNPAQDPLADGLRRMVRASGVSAGSTDCVSAGPSARETISHRSAGGNGVRSVPEAAQIRAGGADTPGVHGDSSAGVGDDSAAEEQDDFSVGGVGTTDVRGDSQIGGVVTDGVHGDSSAGVHGDPAVGVHDDPSVAVHHAASTGAVVTAEENGVYSASVHGYSFDEGAGSDGPGDTSEAGRARSGAEDLQGPSRHAGCRRRLPLGAAEHAPVDAEEAGRRCRRGRPAGDGVDSPHLGDRVAGTRARTAHPVTAAAVSRSADRAPTSDDPTATERAAVGRRSSGRRVRAPTKYSPSKQADGGWKRPATPDGGCPAGSDRKRRRTAGRGRQASASAAVSAPLASSPATAVTRPTAASPKAASPKAASPKAASPVATQASGGRRSGRASPPPRVGRRATDRLPDGSTAGRRAVTPVADVARAEPEPESQPSPVVCEVRRSTRRRAAAAGAVRTRSAGAVSPPLPPPPPPPSSDGAGGGRVSGRPRRRRPAVVVLSDAESSPSLPRSSANRPRVCSGGRSRGRGRAGPRESPPVPPPVPPPAPAAPAPARRRHRPLGELEDEGGDGDVQFVDLAAPSEVSTASVMSVRSTASSGRAASARHRPRVLFTGCSDSDHEPTVVRLGGTVVQRPTECTVLVSMAVKRTIKFMAGFALGIPIVSPAWIAKSKQAKYFLDPWEFLVSDRAAEGKFGFRLGQNLRKASRRAHRLLHGWSVYVTPSVVPPPDQLREIVECGGGVFLERPPRSTGDRLLVVSCLKDTAYWAAAHRLHLPIVSVELLLTGILRQDLDVNQHRLRV